MNSYQLLVGVLVLINIISFIATAIDKHKSIKKNTYDRTPEGIIFFQAILFGSFGVFLAMVIFRHKTKKWYFQIGIPLLILQNLATFYVINSILIT